MHSVWRVLRVSGGLNEIFGGPAGALVAGHKVSNWVFMAHPQIRGGGEGGAGGDMSRGRKIVEEDLLWDPWGE